MPVHGHACRGKQSPTYHSWYAMRRRCNNPTYQEYKYYGGRGISVCKRWERFENFLADMGVKPRGLTIERIDNSGNYEPSNCEWATYQKQARNTRRSKVVEFRGEKKPLVEWAEVVPIPYHTLKARLKYGWSPEKAFTTPILSIHEISKLGNAASKLRKATS